MNGKNGKPPSAFFGAPDILVNAAGVNLRQSWDEISDATWDKQIDINLKAPFFLARHLIAGMQEKGWGKIINIASLQSEWARFHSKGTNWNETELPACLFGISHLTRTDIFICSSGPSGWG